MKAFRLQRALKSTPWLLFFLVGMLTIFYLWGIPHIPFHPDESTQLFTSGDFELLLKHPTSMTWDPEKEDDLRQRYRELDAPLTRYVLGIGRSIAGLPSLPVDWDWSQTWEENRRSGSLPNPQLLYIGRLTVTLLVPISLLFLYLIAESIGGSFTGLIAALIMGINALILLHTRRAMAESALTFGITFALWSFLQGYKRPWLAGIGMALAFNAKQSTAALLPVGLLAVAWFPIATDHRGRMIIRNMLIFVGTLGFLTMILNPIWWNQPAKAVQASWSKRQNLVSRQVADTERVAPEKVLQTPSERAVFLLANLYVAPLSFAEVGNYMDQTSATEASYLAIPGHDVLRGFIGGGILLVLTLLGLILATLHLPQPIPEQRRYLSLLLLATLFQIGFHLVAVPLPWQRYIIPLVPLACLWAAYGLSPLTQLSPIKKASHGNEPVAG